MIEGLRLLPGLQEASRRNPDAVAHYWDCSKCKATFPREMRRAIGCAWEPSLEGATPWKPEWWKGDPPTVCVGYSTKLPEVIETSEARFYLKSGSLSALIKGPMSDSLRTGIRLLENADTEASNWAAKQR